HGRSRQRGPIKRAIGHAPRVSESLLRERPLFLALALVGTILGGLLVGYEPVGGDPDRMYRPLKSELARALEHGRLPFWSDRFGVGLPLVAESHVAAFYPPNLVLYRALDLPAAYRLSMWLHYLALAATYFHARSREQAKEQTVEDAEARKRRADEPVPVGLGEGEESQDRPDHQRSEPGPDNGYGEAQKHDLQDRRIVEPVGHGLTDLGGGARRR